MISSVAKNKRQKHEITSARNGGDDIQPSGKVMYEPRTVLLRTDTEKRAIFFGYHIKISGVLSLPANNCALQC